MKTWVFVAMVGVGLLVPVATAPQEVSCQAEAQRLRILVRLHHDGRTQTEFMLAAAEQGRQDALREVARLQAELAKKGP